IRIYCNIPAISFFLFLEVPRIMRENRENTPAARYDCPLILKRTSTKRVGRVHQSHRFHG
ncbi:MAG: hypothetical protein JSV75_00760, partial [Candidatus Bathyarchaeota archaeon]